MSGLFEDKDMESKSRDLSFENAISISRQWGILIDDYRYLLQKFTSDCSCHLKFDNTYFFKGMEQRYEALKRMANDNDYLSSFNDDDNDWNALNNIWKNRTNKVPEDLNINQNKSLIKRITVVHNDSVNEKTQPPITTASMSSLTKRSRKQFEKATNEDPNESTAAADVDVSNLPTKVYKCEVKECDFTTMNYAKSQSHLRYHHTIADTAAPIPNSSILQICHDCGKEFSTEEGLKNHIQNSHVDVKVWKCEYANCSYQTKFRSCFRDHMIRHSGKKNFQCEWYGCGKVFSTRRDLSAHVNFGHRGIRRFTCEYPECDASFKDSNRLKHHEYTHTGERPYKCNYRDCEARFKQIPHLKKHQKTHLNKPNDDDDGEEYEDYGNLDDNITGYCCPIEECALAFLNTNEFQQHLREQHPDIDEVFKDDPETIYISWDQNEN